MSISQPSRITTCTEKDFRAGDYLGWCRGKRRGVTHPWCTDQDGIVTSRSAICLARRLQCSPSENQPRSFPQARWIHPWARASVTHRPWSGFPSRHAGSNLRWLPRSHSDTAMLPLCKRGRMSWPPPTPSSPAHVRYDVLPFTSVRLCPPRLNTHDGRYTWITEIRACRVIQGQISPQY